MKGKFIMKKLITAALAAVLALTMSVAAFAAEPYTVNQSISPDNVDVTVTTAIEPTYTVSIPANTGIALNATSTPFGAIEVTAAQLNPGKVIKVTVAAGELKNTEDNAKTIPYKVMTNTGEFTSAEYTAVGQKTDLTLDIELNDWNRAFAGNYSGTVTFTVAYVDKAAN